MQQHSECRVFLCALFLCLTSYVCADSLIDANSVVPMFSTNACMHSCDFGGENSTTRYTVKEVDVNGDRVSEYLVSASSDCGRSGRCPSALFISKHGEWKTLVEAWTISLLKTKTRGYLDIDTADGRYAWSGTSYSQASSPPDARHAAHGRRRTAAACDAPHSGCRRR